MAITKHTLEEQRDSLAKFLPSGCLLAAKDVPDTIFFKLIQGIAKEFVRMECAAVELQEQHNPANTTVFIEEWEASLGIPDDCFDTRGTLDERRLNIIVKFSLMNLQTRQDFIDLAALYGFDIDFQMMTDRGAKVFPLTFPITFQIANPLDINFVVFVRFLNATAPQAAGFPFTFPILFASAGLNIVQCLFEKLKPVDVKLVFEFLGTPKPVFPFTFPIIFAPGPFDVGC